MGRMLDASMPAALHARHGCLPRRVDRTVDPDAGGRQTPARWRCRAPELVERPASIGTTTSKSVPAERRAAGRLIEREHPALVQQATRVQRSASSRYGVDIRMVMPCARNSRQQLPELAPRHRIDAGRRLVEHDHLRLVHERARQRELLLHAAGQPIGQAAAEPRQLRHVEEAIAARRKSRTPWISAKNAMFSSMLRSP